MTDNFVVSKLLSKKFKNKKEQNGVSRSLVLF